MIKPLIIGLLLFMGIGLAEAPIRETYTLRVRLTAYSPKQPRETSINHRGKSIKNEDGIAVPKGLLPDGTVIKLPDGSYRTVDDRIPYKSAKKFGCMVIDVRYYQTITAKPKTKSVNKQLRELDMGRDEIAVYR